MIMVARISQLLTEQNVTVSRSCPPFLCRWPIRLFQIYIECENKICSYQFIMARTGLDGYT